jgi:hypothetical protein
MARDTCATDGLSKVGTIGIAHMFDGPLASCVPEADMPVAYAVI